MGMIQLEAKIFINNKVQAILVKNQYFDLDKDILRSRLYLKTLNASFCYYINIGLSKYKSNILLKICKEKRIFKFISWAVT